MQIGASTGSELGSFCAWSGSELGSFYVWSESELGSFKCLTASSADRGASVCGSFRLARCVGRSSQALCACERGSACERGMENV